MKTIQMFFVGGGGGGGGWGRWWKETAWIVKLYLWLPILSTCNNVFLRWYHVHRQILFHKFVSYLLDRFPFYTYHLLKLVENATIYTYPEKWPDCDFGSNVPVMSLYHVIRVCSNKRSSYMWVSQTTISLTECANNFHSTCVLLSP